MLDDLSHRSPRTISHRPTEPRLRPVVHRAGLASLHRLSRHEGAEHITVDLFLRWKTVFKLSRGCRITYRPKVISTPLALRLKLTPWCVDTIWISTPLSFFIAVTLAPPASAAPAETAV